MYISREKTCIQVAMAGNACSASSAGIARRGAAAAVSHKAKDEKPQKKCPIKCNISTPSGWDDLVYVIFY
ncbi:MAG: hypothetical protein FWG98_10490 [Candidatus Cloacimonetes bacterium]|nr:hypothetical protein [Candidatus Cloacimonadota bacterium]